jgi:hypothetical protein
MAGTIPSTCSDARESPWLSSGWTADSGESCRAKMLKIALAQLINRSRPDSVGKRGARRLHGAWISELI